jgi:hypothetical protein
LWKWTLDGDADSIAVAVESAEQPVSSGEPRGCSADHFVVVSALREGRACLHLILTRGIPGGPGPAAAYDVLVSVLAEIIRQ